MTKDLKCAQFQGLSITKVILLGRNRMYMLIIICLSVEKAIKLLGWKGRIFSLWPPSQIVKISMFLIAVHSHNSERGTSLCLSIN